jgi:hypothetical protein
VRGLIKDRLRLRIETKAVELLNVKSSNDTVCFRAKSANGGSILSSSQFLILPQLPQKIKLASKVVKGDSKIIISIPKKLTVEATKRQKSSLFF